MKKEHDTRIERLRDAKLIVDAIVRHPPDTPRHAFVRRLQKSYREYGSLTEAMRLALTPPST
jgi:hypothetical protein